MKKVKSFHTPAKNVRGGTDRGDFHVSHTSMGMGDYYGTGVRNPMGKVIDGMGMNPPSRDNTRKPPRSLA